MSSEEKMVSQLKTYLILSKTLGPSYVLKQEKRKHIFEAIRLYHDNKNIAQISVNLLELLVDKTQDKEVFSEIMENFGNIAALVSTNKTDVEFSRNFISLVAKITEKDKTVIQQLNDLAYERTFWEIQNQHVKNKHIQDLFEIISDILGIKKRIMKIKPEPQWDSTPEKDNLAAMPYANLTLQFSDCDSTTSNDNSSLENSDPLSNADSIEFITNQDSFNLDSDKEKKMEEHLVNNVGSRDSVDGLTSNHATCDSDSEDEDDSSATAVNSFITSREGKSKRYTARRFHELQILRAQRKQKLIEYQEVLSKQEWDYVQLQDERQTLSNENTSEMMSFLEAGEKFDKEIKKLKHENEMLEIKEKDMSEDANTLLSEMDNIQTLKNEKKMQFKKLKAIVTRQMSKAREHYNSITNHLEATKCELTNVQCRLLDTESKLTATQKE